MCLTHGEVKWLAINLRWLPFCENLAGTACVKLYQAMCFSLPLTEDSWRFCWRICKLSHPTNKLHHGAADTDNSPGDLHPTKRCWSISHWNYNTVTPYCWLATKCMKTQTKQWLTWIFYCCVITFYSKTMGIDMWLLKASALLKRLCSRCLKLAAGVLLPFNHKSITEVSYWCCLWGLAHSWRSSSSTWEK